MCFIYICICMLYKLEENTLCKPYRNMSLGYLDGEICGCIGEGCDEKR